MKATSTRSVGLGLLFLFAASAVVVAAPAHVPVLLLPAEALPLEVVVDLPEGIVAGESAAWELVEQDGSQAVVPVDVSPAMQPDGKPNRDRLRLVATIPPRPGAEGLRRFPLRRADAAATPATPAFAWERVSSASLRLAEGGRPVLVYNFGDVTNPKVPKSDFRRTRGCYFHPIYGLDGEVLTDDFPRDHYHHHGLFWAWPHVQIGEETYDLWERPGMQIRFVRWLGRDAAQASAMLAVENGWFVGKRKAMTERVWITAHKASDVARAIDIEATWIPVDRPVTRWGREEKSYGGMTIRFAIPRGHSGTITVPSGESKDDLAVTRLPWADLSYPFGGATAAPSGAALMISPSHPDYPPTWLTRHYGPLCVGYPGVAKKTLAPGEPLTLRYRLWIHRGPGMVEDLKEAYDAYVGGQSARWE